MMLLICPIMDFSVYWEKKKKIIFWSDPKGSFMVSLRSEKPTWHPSHPYPLSSFTAGGLDRKLIGFKAAKSDQQSSAGNYVFF